MISSMGPAFRLIDPETTHNLGIEAAKWGLFPKETRPDPQILKTTVWGREFPNPIGKKTAFVASPPCMETLAGHMEVCPMLQSHHVMEQGVVFRVSHYY